ncbi:MAG: S1C family serine protease [candidate division NC10 bacterium]
MDAQIGLARALVPLTVALHVRIPGDHPSVATLGEERMGSAFNPGFGGGPLFDIRGRMVGVTSLNLGQVGRFSLAIPIHQFTEHRHDLLRFGRVRDRGRRAWIGFYPQPTVSGIEVAGEDRAEFYR